MTTSARTFVLILLAAVAWPGTPTRSAEPAAKDAVPPTAKDAVPPAAKDAVPPAAKDAVPESASSCTDEEAWGILTDSKQVLSVEERFMLLKQFYAEVQSASALNL